MIDKVRRYISENSLIESKDRIIISLSGGPDSTALFHLLLMLKDEMDIRLRAFHLNHMLRGEESDRDERFCINLCGQAGMEIDIHKEDISLHARDNKLSAETAGRKRRYELLDEIMKKERFNKAATAHNLDDSVESVLMNIFRGTGLNGLCGIPARRGALIRPLLCVRKSEILEYLKSNGLDYCVDRTNTENDFLRNHIRNDILISAGKRFNTDITGNISRMINNLSEDEAFINEAVNRIFDENVKTKTDMACIRKEILLNNKPSISKRLILKAVECVKGDTVDIEEKHIRSIAGLAGKQSGAKADLPGSVYALLEFDRICIKQLEKESMRTEPAVHIRFGEETGFGGWTFRFGIVESMGVRNIQKNDKSAYLDLDRIGDRDLLLRYRQEGDIFSPFKRNVTKKLRKYFIESRVPACERDSIPLLAAGEEILWIAGHDISHRYAAGRDTKKILLCEYFERGAQTHD